MKPAEVDPVTFEVVWHRLLDITEEMGIKYMRTSGSPVLVGAYDASTGITLPDGELVAMGPYITTQAHVLRLIIGSVIERRTEHPGINPGDMYICNDPYLGATHQPDVATVAPVHAGDELIAWVGSSGHWLDIGGPEPGGFTMTARSVFDEGLRMPPTRIVEGGETREDLVQLIMNQIREPLAELDLRGQMVANRTGTERLLAVADEYGLDTVQAVMRQGVDNVERRLRERLRTLPDGVWRDVQYLDHDGHQPNMRPIVCTITKQGDQLTIDFEGTAPEVEGFANCTRGGLRAATLSAVSIMLGYDLTWNDGIARCVDIKAPSRTAVTAEFPTPVSMATISAIIVTLNLVFGTLSRMMLASPLRDEAMANWCGTSLGVSMMGHNEDDQLTICAEASHFAAGCGARPDEDGVDTGGIIINTTANIPSIEQTESEYPLLYLFRRQLTDSGGPGRFRGGVAGEVAIVPHRGHGAMETSFAGVGAQSPNAYGLAGGLPGATARYIRFDHADIPGVLGHGGPLPSHEGAIGGERRVSPINSSHAPFPRDMVEYHNWQGGGGYGDPLERDPASVARDVREQLVSPEAARDVYGVVLTDGAVDGAATEARREELRSARRERAVPASELPGPGDDLPSVPSQQPTTTIAYGDLITVDPAGGRASCTACAADLGPVEGDLRAGCLVELGPPSEAGAVRGQDYGDGPLTMRRYHCPGCLRQLDVEFVLADGPRPGSRLAM